MISLTHPLLQPVRPLARRLYAQCFRGEGRHCPVCEKDFASFASYGVVKRLDARCPACLAMERHRLVYIFLRDKTDLFDGRDKRMLHIAPEELMSKLFRDACGEGYLSGDLDPTRAMVPMDITDIQYPDDTFDVLYVSHVFEHVPDDRKAIAECYRVLKPGGWAVLNVPIMAEETVEDPSVTDPKERLRLFGQEDHVRRYGPDYKNRLTDAGFELKIFTVEDLVPAEKVELYGLRNEAVGEIYYGKKPLP